MQNHTMHDTNDDVVHIRPDRAAVIGVDRPPADADPTVRFLLRHRATALLHGDEGMSTVEYAIGTVAAAAFAAILYAVVTGEHCTLSWCRRRPPSA